MHVCTYANTEHQQPINLKRSALYALYIYTTSAANLINLQQSALYVYVCTHNESPCFIAVYIRLPVLLVVCRRGKRMNTRCCNYRVHTVNLLSRLLVPSVPHLHLETVVSVVHYSYRRLRWLQSDSHFQILQTHTEKALNQLSTEVEGCSVWYSTMEQTVLNICTYVLGTWRTHNAYKIALFKHFSTILNIKACLHIFMHLSFESDDQPDHYVCKNTQWT